MFFLCSLAAIIGIILENIEPWGQQKTSGFLKYQNNQD